MAKEQTTWIESKEPRVGTEPPVPPIEWCTRGSFGGSDNVVVIYDVDQLVKELLPRFAFAQTTPSSFVRKLCRWGFRQVSATYGGVKKNYSNRPHSSHMYECIHFKSGNFGLLNRMTSNTAEKRRYEESLAASSSDQAVNINGGTAAVESAANFKPKSRSKVSPEQKRSRAQLERDDNRREEPRISRGTQEEVFCQGQVAVQSRGVSNVRNEGTDQHPGHANPTQMLASHARSLLGSVALEASAAHDIQQVAFAHQSLYTFMQRQAMLSTRLAAPSNSFPPLSGADHNIPRIISPSQLQILETLFNSYPTAVQQRPWFPPVATSFHQSAAAFGTRSELTRPQAPVISDLSIQMLIQILQSAQQPLPCP
jgi:HSF-type DNA-binding